MRGDEREVLSALIDREPVDPDVLARVLEDPANRRLLVDFVRVRVAAQAEVPGERSGRRRPRLPAPQRASWPGHGPRGRGAPARRAGAGGGAWVHEYATRERPPDPSRVVQFEPGV
jgi:hypothetical protein